jgi:hypothetical protein
MERLCVGIPLEIRLTAQLIVNANRLTRNWVPGGRAAADPDLNGGEGA